MRPVRDEKGNLSTYAFPGGYPLIYIASDNEVICPACANKPEFSVKGEPPEAFASNIPWSSDFILVSMDIHYEGPPEFCAHCNAEIASAYGDPDSPDEDSGEAQPEPTTD